MVAVIKQRTLAEEFRNGSIGLYDGRAQIDAAEAVRYQAESGSDLVCLLIDGLANMSAPAHDRLNTRLIELMTGDLTFDDMANFRDRLREAMTNEAQRSLNRLLELLGRT